MADKPPFDATLAERITTADIDAALHLRALLRSMKTTWLRLAGLHIELCAFDDCHEPQPDPTPTDHSGDTNKIVHDRP